MKAGTSSYTRPLSTGTLCQTTVVTEPVTMPQNTPHLVVRFHQSESTMPGPNAAPRPDQAYSTNQKTRSFTPRARTKAITPMSTVPILLIARSRF